MKPEELRRERAEIKKEFEEWLAEVKSPFDFEDILDIIYNEEDSDDMMKIVKIFDDGDVSNISNALELATDAWNHFPHKALGGKSPVEMGGNYKDLSEKELVAKLDSGFNGPEDLKDIISAMESKGMRGGMIQMDDGDPVQAKVVREYIDSHKLMVTDQPTKREIQKAIKDLTRKNLSDHDSKWAILILAHSGDVKALRALEKYHKKAQGEIVIWAKTAISECKMFLESELMDRAQIKVEGLDEPTEKEIKKSKVGRLFNFFFSDENELEIKRAIRDFFDGSVDPDRKELAFTNEIEEDMFMDWLVFDYVFTNGKKLIDNYLEKNGGGLPKKDRSAYEEMLFNKYGLFEVKKIEKDKWIDLESISTGKVHRVKEKKGTHGSRVGRLLIGRLGKEGGEWRMISSNPIEVPLQFTERAKIFFGEGEQLTPKDFRFLISKLWETK